MPGWSRIVVSLDVELAVLLGRHGPSVHRWCDRDADEGEPHGVEVDPLVPFSALLLTRDDLGQVR
jgi:hypothetical protein